MDLASSWFAAGLFVFWLVLTWLSLVWPQTTESSSSLGFGVFFFHHRNSVAEHWRKPAATKANGKAATLKRMRNRRPSQISAINWSQCLLQIKTRAFQIYKQKPTTRLIWQSDSWQQQNPRWVLCFLQRCVVASALLLHAGVPHPVINENSDLISIKLSTILSCMESRSDRFCFVFFGNEESPISFNCNQTDSNR